MKHLHCLTYNSLGKKPHVFTYQFGNTKNVMIRVSYNAVSISARLSNQYDAHEMSSNNCYLFPDAIRKALLVHILLYSKNISIKTISVRIDEKEDLIEVSDKSKPYSLISTGVLERRIPSIWNDPSIIQNILKQTQSNADSRMAALYAYVCSKDKQFETERFMYLWMAFNGLYGSLSKLISKQMNQAIKREYKQIIHMLQFLSIGNETIKEEDKSRIAHEVIALLIKHGPILRSDFMRTEENSISNQIIGALFKQNGDPYDLTAYGYVLTQLISFADDSQLVILRILNILLEEFLDNNLHKWFDDEFLEKELNPFIKTCILK